MKISVIFWIFNSQNFHNFFLFGNSIARSKEIFILTLSFLKTGLLILTFKCEIYGCVFSSLCIDSIHKQILKTADAKNINRVFRQQNPHPDYWWKAYEQINSNTDSHWINEKETDTKSLRIQYTPYNCLLKNANFQSKLPITK